METGIQIERLQQLDSRLPAFVDMLIAVVHDGASIGFLTPLSRAAAEQYWRSVPGDDVIVLIATVDGQLAGTVQIHLCSKPNGMHRAEIAKLIVHPQFRRRGIARLLMECAEQYAKQAERILLVLDTRDGDPSNTLYRSLGYIQAGQIPQFAISDTGILHATNLYYKLLQQPALWTMTTENDEQ
ncbi:GNAT family N-acetyltransferase [Paenibacillus campi]|uniref:GNAT family N-acetyltransferase n=1 Tax=Paenibacillus campi TaxID=3106031 RepID=UPI002B000AF6|nr:MULTISPECIES: GNAT family N-acetyltransferase [unclassified Paenibacillus]